MFLHFSYLEVRMRPKLLKGTPNSHVIEQPNGWMNAESFVQYLRYFISNPSKNNTILLTIDNHSSHTSLETINLCKDNGIVMIGLPPQSTLGVLFAPLKTYARLVIIFL